MSFRTFSLKRDVWMKLLLQEPHIGYIYTAETQFQQQLLGKLLTKILAIYI